MYIFKYMVIYTSSKDLADTTNKEELPININVFKRIFEPFLTEIAEYYKCHIDGIEYSTSEELEIVIRVKKRFLNKCKYDELEKNLISDINTLIEMHDLKIPVKLKVVLTK